MFPIHEDSQTQSQTDDVPDWASYSNSDLNIATGNGRATWTQETVNSSTFKRVRRGRNNLANVGDSYSFDLDSDDGLRLVFELI